MPATGLPHGTFVRVLALVLAASAPVSVMAQAQEEVTTLSGVDVLGGAVPVPQVGLGAPLYTQEELLEMGQAARFDASHFESERAYLEGCYLNVYGVTPNLERTQGYVEAAEAARRLASASVVAEKATLTAIQARLDAASGAVSMDYVIETELARQDAVLRLREAQGDLLEAEAVSLDIQELIRNREPVSAWRGQISARAAARARVGTDPWALVPEEYRDLKLHNIRAVEFIDEEGQPFIQVQGAIENTRARRISIPPLAVLAVDPSGYELVSQTASVRGQIQPGESKAFSYDLKPSPTRTARITVTFAGIQTATYLAPVSTDPVCAGEMRAELDPALGMADHGPPSIRNTRFTNDIAAMRASQGQGTPGASAGQ